MWNKSVTEMEISQLNNWWICKIKYEKKKSTPLLSLLKTEKRNRKSGIKFSNKSKEPNSKSKINNRILRVDRKIIVTQVTLGLEVHPSNFPAQPTLIQMTFGTAQALKKIKIKKRLLLEAGILNGIRLSKITNNSNSKRLSLPREVQSGI